MSLPENFLREENLVSTRKLNGIVDNTKSTALMLSRLYNQKPTQRKAWHPWRIIETQSSTPEAKKYGIRKQDCQLRTKYVTPWQRDNSFLTGYYDPNDETPSEFEVAVGDIVYLQINAETWDAEPSAEIKMGEPWENYPVNFTTGTYSPAPNNVPYTNKFYEPIAFAVDPSTEGQGYIVGDLKFINVWKTPMRIAYSVNAGVYSFDFFACGELYGES